MREQIGENVVAVLIPRPGRRTRIAAEHNLERRIRWVAGEIFIRINVEIGGVINGEEFHLIEVHRFFQRLHETKTQLAISFAKRVAVELDGFGRTSNVALDVVFSGCDPVSNHARAQHVADELVFVAVPSEKRRTGTAAAVHFQKILTLVGGDFDFILQYAGRPQHADDVGNFRLPKTDGQVGRVLSEVAGRSIHFKLLPQASGEDFHLRADGALVVVQSLERKPQRVVLVAAFVVEQHGGSVILRDQKIDGAVIVVVTSDDGARLFELNFVESSFGGDIFEAVRAEIAEEADFTFAVFRLANSDKIDPAVVVVVDGGHTVGPDPIRVRQFHSVEVFAVIVAP